MSVFKEHKSHADRSASDRRRHRDKIDRAIKEGIYDIVAEESIIGQDGKKKIKIPVKGIKEYRFIYGENQKVGSAQGRDVKRGQKVGTKQSESEQGNGPGDAAGEEYYEVEITLEELVHYLFDSLSLPDLEKKQMKQLFSQKIKRHGYRDKGIRPRLDKKETVKKMLKRRNVAKRAGKYDEENDESFAFNEKDLKYKHFKNTVKQHSNAVIFFLMDISGSMTQTKKYLARSFFFLLYHFVRSKYENTELVFVAHDVEAYEVNEEQFFKRGSGGGTIVSSGLNMLNNIMTKRFHPENWNVYIFQCTDGDNWPGDNENVAALLQTMKPQCQLFGYCEVDPEEDRLKWAGDESSLTKVYKNLEDSRCKVITLTAPQDIWPAFKTFFGGNLANV